MIWRSAILAGYLALGLALALVFSFVFDGGPIVLVFFCVWGLVWLAFSLFWGWADRVRQLLLRPPSSS